MAKRSSGRSIAHGDGSKLVDTPRHVAQVANRGKTIEQIAPLVDVSDALRKRAFAAVLGDHLRRDGTEAVCRDTADILQMLGLKYPDFVWVRDGTSGQHSRMKVSVAEYEAILEKRRLAKERERQRADALHGVRMSQADLDDLLAKRDADDQLLHEGIKEAVRILREGAQDGGD